MLIHRLILFSKSTFVKNKVLFYKVQFSNHEFFLTHLICFNTWLEFESPRSSTGLCMRLQGGQGRAGRTERFTDPLRQRIGIYQSGTV